LSQLSERKQIIEDAVRFNRPSRIPLQGNFWTYKIIDSEYTLREALYDWDVMYKVVCGFHERYEYDYYGDTGTRNPFAFTESMDGNFYQINDEEQTLNIDDVYIMNEEDYPAFIEDPIKFLWTTGLARKCKAMDAPNALERFADAISEFNKIAAYTAKITRQFTDVYGVPRGTGAMALHPFELFFNFYRGIKGTSIDVRKHKTELMEACRVWAERFVEPGLEAAIAGPKEEDVAFDIGSAFLGHSILSAKQFGEIYWPWLKKYIDKIAAAGKTITIFSESYCDRFYEYLQEVPKGVMAVHVEQDDIFKLRKLLPNVCLVGGMPTDLLGYADKQTCVDYAHKLIDELAADGGGYILSQNKMMSYKNDAKSENLLAVNEFVKNYSAYAQEA